MCLFTSYHIYIPEVKYTEKPIWCLPLEYKITMQEKCGLSFYPSSNSTHCTEFKGLLPLLVLL